MPQPAFCRRAVKVKAKTAGLYASRRPFDETRCDRRTRYAYPSDCRSNLRVGEGERDRSQSHPQPTVAKNATLRSNLARSFCSIFKSLAWASEANRIGIHDAKSHECDIAGDQIPTPNSFPRFRVASKAHDVTLCDGIQLAATRSVWKEPAVTMDDNFFDPPLSQLRILVVGQRARMKARSLLLACESCDSDAEFPSIGFWMKSRSRSGLDGLPDR